MPVSGDGHNHALKCHRLIIRLAKRDGYTRWAVTDAFTQELHRTLHKEGLSMHHLSNGLRVDRL